MAVETRLEALGAASLNLVLSLARAAGEGDPEVLARSLAELRRLVPYRSGFLMTLEGQRGRLIALGADGHGPSEPTPSGRALAPVPLTAAYLRALPKARGKSLPRFVPQGPAQSGLTVPLLSSSAVVGALYLSRAKAFTDSELGILDRIAPHVAAHVAAAQRIEGTVNRLYQLALVNAASRRMSANIRSETLVRDVVTAIQTTFGFDHVILFDVDEAAGEAREIAYAGRQGPRRGIHRQPLQKGLVGHAARRAEPVVANDVRRDPRYVRGSLRGTRSELAIPLLFSGKVIGVLDLGSVDLSAFDRSTIVILETLASQVANFLRNAEHFERARLAAERLRVLLATSRQMARAVDNENVLPVITDQAKVLLRATECAVYRLMPDGVTLRPEGEAQRPRRRSLHVGKGIVGTVLVEGRPEIWNDVESEARVRSLRLASGRAHVMVAPLHSRGLTVGAMVVARRDAPFAPEDLDIFSIFAGLAADALRRVELHREIRETKDFLERIVESSADAIVTTDLKGHITLYSPGAEALFGYARSEVMGRPVSTFMARGRREGTRLMKRLWKSERLASYEIQFRHKAGQVIICNMSASLLRDTAGHPIGTLGISKDISERVRLERRLRELTIEDDLTGLHNVRHFWDSAGYELRRARRQGTPLSLFLFDVDRFKRYNDTHGHLGGDTALALIGRIVAGNVRSDIDRAFRYGGDEFVVILPGANVRSAHRIADRIRRKVGAATGGELGISVGLVELTERMVDARRFVHAADRAMYRAKQKGGDCVEIA